VGVVRLVSGSLELLAVRTHAVAVSPHGPYPLYLPRHCPPNTRVLTTLPGAVLCAGAGSDARADPVHAGDGAAAAAHSRAGGGLLRAVLHAASVAGEPQVRSRSETWARPRLSDVSPVRLSDLIEPSEVERRQPSEAAHPPLDQEGSFMRAEGWRLSQPPCVQRVKFLPASTYRTQT
jgi:hypothetical protein